MKTNPNQFIFEFAATSASGDVYQSAVGLTKREYFAAMALQGLLVNNNNYQPVVRAWCAEHAVKCADALIEELNKE